MRGYKLVITEQPPTEGGRVYCEVELLSIKGRGSVRFGHQMYFVCDKDKVITQYFPWMESKDFVRDVAKLGYTLNT